MERKKSLLRFSELYFKRVSRGLTAEEEAEYMHLAKEFGAPLPPVSEKPPSPEAIADFFIQPAIKIIKEVESLRRKLER